MPLTLRYVARSDVGLVREGNEDSGYAGPRLLAVADGMGGHAAGEVASSATIEELLSIENRDTDGDPLQVLAAAVRSANRRISQLAAENPARRGMGTTLTALFWTGEHLALAHIGDSRAYLLRDGQLRQITHDHTLVQTLVDEGRITVEEASVHPARSMILRTLQGDGEPDVDLQLVEVRSGDRILVCSDGLSGVVRDETMRDTLAGNRDVAAAADALVELALKGGAPDNVTCVVAEVVESDAPRASDDTAEAYLVGAAGGEKPGARTNRSRRSPGAAMRNLLRGGPPAATRDEEDAEALRYAPRPPQPYRWLRRLAVLAVLAAALWVGLLLFDDYVDGQYYVGDQSGDVAVFRGVNQEVGAIRLSDLHHVADGLPIAALPAVFRDRVIQTIPADDLSDADQIVGGLRREACRAHTPPPTPTPIPTTPTAAPPGTRLTPSPGVPPVTAARPTPTSQSTPSPTPSPTPTFPGLDCSESTQ